MLLVDGFLKPAQFYTYDKDISISIYKSSKMDDDNLNRFKEFTNMSDLEELILLTINLFQIKYSIRLHLLHVVVKI